MSSTLANTPNKGNGVNTNNSVTSNSSSKNRTHNNRPPTGVSYTPGKRISSTAENLAPGAIWLYAFRTELQRVIDDNKCRVMSLHECREIITMLYDSKDSINSRVTNTGSKNSSFVPETMEQHVYRWMEKKYGLRSISVEHAAMLLTTVRLYCEEHIDVEVFYKIFCNDVDEEYYKVHLEIQQSIRDLMMVQMTHK